MDYMWFKKLNIIKRTLKGKDQDKKKDRVSSESWCKDQTVETHVVKEIIGVDSTSCFDGYKDIISQYNTIMWINENEWK